MASSKIKGITIEIGGNTTKLGKALEGVNKQSKDLQSELKGVNSLLKLDPSNVELLKQKQDLLTKSITETESKQKILAETLKQIDSGKVKVTEEQYRDLQREIVLTDSKLEKLSDEMKNFGSVSQAQLKAVGDNLIETGDKISEAGNKVAGVSAVAGAGLVASGKLAADNEAAVNRYITATGTAVTEADNFKSILDDMYSNNYGESYQELAEKLALVKQNFKDISDTDLQSITENAYLLEDAFGMDFLESVRGINGLMTNMGVTSTEAFNLMVTGAQNGLNKSNELGDNIAEYSQLWGQAGFSAEEMFAILQNGLDSGAYNLDKVNDFVKEFSISLSDGRIEDNLGSFSTKSQDLFKAWKNGEASSKDVFYSIVSDLENMENKQEALTIASNVWSALGEDNAMSVITSLNDVNKTYTDTTGAVDQANETTYGGCVRAKKYLLTYKKIGGYGRPNYVVEKEEASEVQIKYVYNCEILNVRKKPSAQGTILRTINKGTQVTVYEISGTWARIGTNEWCSNKYLSDNKPIVYKTKKVFNCNTLNIRNKPSLLGKKIGTLKKGTKVNVYSTSGTWSKISEKEEKYCSSKYLK